MRQYLRHKRIRGAVFRSQVVGIDREHLDRRIAAGRRRAEGPQQAGALIARAEKEGEQTVGRCIHQHDALAAG